MAAASKLVHFFFLFCRYLAKSIRACSFLQALKQFLRHLASNIFGFNLAWYHKTRPKEPELPPSTSAQLPETPIGKSEGKHSVRKAFDPGFAYSTVSDGETVPFSDIMPSIYPHSGSGIHNASHTSVNLQTSRLAHSSNIQSSSRNPSQSNSRNPSQSNLAVGFRLPESFVFSNGEVEENITITVQNPEPGSPTTPPPSSNDIALVTLPISSRNYAGDTSTSHLSRTELHGVTTPTISLTQGRTTSVSTLDADAASTRPSSPVPENTTAYSDISVTPLADERITPVMPEIMRDLRYKERPTIEKKSRRFDIQPFTLWFEEKPPDGWGKCTHPEGVRYFINWETGTYTEADLEDPRIYIQAMKDMKTLEQHRISFDKRHVLNRNDATLVIYTSYQEDNPNIISTCYYYAHHIRRSIIFSDCYNSERMSVRNEIYGPSSADHLRFEIEAQYWTHVHLYPDSTRLNKEIIAELRDVVLHFIGDTMTSPTSTAPYSIPDLQDLLKLTKDMEKNVDKKAVTGAQSLLARQMFIFFRSKYLHFHGERHARVERNFSVYGDNVAKRTWLVQSLSPFLFFAPDFHLTNLQNMWTDRIMHKSVFRESMRKMNEEWDHFVLFATVMLNANVAFLAIQSVDNNETPNRSAAQISSYVSMFASIGSIVLGLHLSRQNKTKGRDNIESIEEVQKYMESHAHESRGLETLAILYSLPYALLIWGMVSFFLAVALVCFMKSDIPTRTIVGFCCLSTIALTFWCIYTNWEKMETSQSATPNQRQENLNVFADSSSSHNQYPTLWA